MRQTILLPQTFLPLHAVQLGRLVLNIEEPHSDYHDPGPVALQDVITKPQHQFHGQESNASTNEFASALCHLLSLNRTKHKGIVTRVSSSQVTTYLLNNSGNWFQQALQNEDTRKWVETANRRGEDIYLVSGYHTVLDAHVYESSTDHDMIAGKVAVPVAEALTATGIFVPFGGMVDPSTTAAHQQQQAGKQSFVAVGEQVCAVQYRKVHFKWYASRELHDKPLGPNRWKTYWTFRGQSDDVIEVDLEDEWQPEDNNVCVYDEDNFSVLDQAKIEASK